MGDSNGNSKPALQGRVTGRGSLALSLLAGLTGMLLAIFALAVASNYVTRDGLVTEVRAACTSDRSSAVTSNPWLEMYDTPDVPNAVPAAVVVDWLTKGIVNALVDVRTLEEFEGLGGVTAPACVNDASVVPPTLPACQLGHANLAPYSAAVPHTVQLAQSSIVTPLQVIFAEDLATAPTDAAFAAALGGANLTGLVVGFMCHDGVNPDNPASNPRSLISATKAKALLGARSFTVGGGMNAWKESGLLSSKGPPGPLNHVDCAAPSAPSCSWRW